MRDGALEFASTSGGGGQLPPFQGLCRGDASACTKVLTAEVRLETKQPISSHHRQALSEEITFVLNGASGVITALFLGGWRLGQKSHAGAWALIAAVTHKAGLMWVALGQGARGLFYYALLLLLLLQLLKILLLSIILKGNICYSPCGQNRYFKVFPI